MLASIKHISFSIFAEAAKNGTGKLTVCATERSLPEVHVVCLRGSRTGTHRQDDSDFTVLTPVVAVLAVLASLFCQTLAAVFDKAVRLKDENDLTI